MNMSSAAAKQEYIPRVFAPMVQQFLWDTPRCNLYAKMGTGKTVMVLTFAELMFFTGLMSRPVLIIGPREVIRRTWPNEAARWDHLHNIHVSVITGTPQERLFALRRDASVYTINYDNIPWLIDSLGNNNWPFGMVIPDESTRLKNHKVSYDQRTGNYRIAGGVRAASLAEIAFKSDYWVNLSGTPHPNGLTDLWGPMWFIDRGDALGHTFKAFKKRWFYSKEWNTKPIARPHAFGEITAKMQPYTLTLDPRDYFDIRKPVVTILRAQLPEAAQKMYGQMQRDYVIQLKDQPIRAVNAAVKSQKCLQISQGTVFLNPRYDDEGNMQAREWVAVHDAKLQMLDSLITELCGAPLIVVYWFTCDLARLREEYPEGKILSEITDAEWNAGRVPLLFVNAKSAGHGLNWQDGGHHLVHYGLWWDGEIHDQVNERIGPMRQFQSGHERDVQYYYIIASPIDELVYDVTVDKSDLQEAFFRFMRRVL